MAGKLMRISKDDPLFGSTLLQPRTITNWSQEVSDTRALDEAIRDMLDSWVSGKPDVRHFSIQGPNRKIVSKLLDELAEIIPPQPITIQFTPNDHFIFERLGKATIFTATGNDMTTHAYDLIPLLLIGTHRAFVQKQAGFMLGLDWGITIAGCVVTCDTLGIKVG